MSDVSELKQFAVVHARNQNIRRYRGIFDRIDNDEEGAPGSWAVVWAEAGDRLLDAGQLLDACRHYAMARFPYADGQVRRYAGTRCVAAFDDWRRECTDIQHVDVDLPTGRAGCWAIGLSSARPRPLLLVMGGIVSVKEQLAPMLPRLQRLGMAGLVAEMPGVGENTLRYDEDSWRLLPALLDAVADRADVSRTYALALSFSGHLALRCAIEDRRIRGIVTAGAPVSEFFTDTRWLRSVPRITIDTLLHLTGAKPEDLNDRLRPMALTAGQLEALRIPVSYLVSRRDEIISPTEVGRLRDHVRELGVLENDDVHASPKYGTQARLWTVLSVLRMRHDRSLWRIALGGLWHVLRMRSRLSRGK